FLADQAPLFRRRKLWQRQTDRPQRPDLQEIATSHAVASMGGSSVRKSQHRPVPRSQGACVLHSKTRLTRSRYTSPNLSATIRKINRHSDLRRTATNSRDQVSSGGRLFLRNFFYRSGLN